MATYFAVLPEGILDTLSLQLHQYLSLPHPRTGCFSLFLPTDDQILEVQAVTPSNSRSWFLDQEVVQDGRLLVMTPIDPAFLVTSLLESGNMEVFRTADDIFDQLSQNMKAPDDEPLGSDSIQAKSVYSLASLKCMHLALRRVCETKDLTSDTVVYRYSKERALQYLRRKVDRLSRGKDLLQSKTVIRSLAKDGLMDDGNEAILEQGRTKAACDFVGQYLSPTMAEELITSYDLVALDKHLDAHIGPLKSATNTTKSSNDTGDGDKKRKAVRGTTGVEKLKKVNTTGMAKLSNFFTKVDKTK